LRLGGDAERLVPSFDAPRSLGPSTLLQAYLVQYAESL
jgi:hypothetical protein